MKTMLNVTAFAALAVFAQSAASETSQDVVNRLFEKGFTHFYVSADGAKVTGFADGQKVEVYLNTTTGTVTSEQVEAISRNEYQRKSGQIETNDHDAYRNDDKRERSYNRDGGDGYSNGDSDHDRNESRHNDVNDDDGHKSRDNDGVSVERHSNSSHDQNENRNEIRHENDNDHRGTERKSRSDDGHKNDNRGHEKHEDHDDNDDD